MSKKQLQSKSITKHRIQSDYERKTRSSTISSQRSYHAKVAGNIPNFKELSVGQLVTVKNCAFKITRELALGRCCEVYVGEDVSSSIKRAVKVFMNHQNYDGALARELRFLSVLAPHTHIVSHKDFIKSDGKDILIHELLNRTLKDIEVFRQEKKRASSQYLIVVLTTNLVEALSHLNEFGVVHADLKPQNIMWCAETEVFKLIDFGVSFSVNENMRHAIQSRAYQAPESIVWNQWVNNSMAEEMPSRPGHRADVWGAGCIIAELIYGSKLYQFGWEGEDVEATIDAAFKRLRGADKFLAAAKSWLTKSMLVDWKKRPDAADLLSEPFCCQETPRPDLLDLVLLPSKVLRLIGFVKAEFQNRMPEILSELFENVLRDLKCSHKVDKESKSLFMVFDSAQISMEAFQILRKTCIGGYTVVASYFPYNDWCSDNFY